MAVPVAGGFISVDVDTFAFTFYPLP